MPPPALFLHLPSPACIEVAVARAFAEVCLKMVRPYPVEVTHVVAMCLQAKRWLSFSWRNERTTRLTQLCGSSPVGKCEANETWRASLEREIAEELTLQVSARHPLGTWYRTRDRSLRRSPDPGGAGYAGRNGATLGASSDGLGEHHVVNGAQVGGSRR